MNILVVEDENIHRELIVDCLKNSELSKYGIIEIDTADSGESGLGKIFKKHYEVILLDYNLGDITGIDVLKKIVSKNIDTAVIMVTGSGDETIAVAAMKNGAYDYVVKSPDYFVILPVVVEKTIERIMLKREQKKHQERINDLLRASIGVTKFDDLDKLLEFILKLACETLEADGGSVMLFDKDKKELEVRVAIGTRANKIIGKRLAIGERIAGLVASERKPILLVGDIKSYPAFKDLARYEDVHSGITAVLSKKELLGIMNIKRTVKKEEFTEHDLNILSIFAGNVTTAIETMKVFTELTSTKVKLDEKLRELKNIQFEMTKPERVAIISELARVIGSELKPYLENIHKLLQTNVPENIKTVLTELTISENFIMNLLNFAGEVPLELKPTNVNEVIEETVDAISEYMLAKNFNIKKELDPRVPLIFADANQLKQMFINLILNAIENRKTSHGELVISTRIINNTLKLINVNFKDDGIGIFHKDDFIKVFNPLYTTKINKLGIGLSVCKKIISEHNGDIRIISKFQEFAEVTINLPIKLNA